MGDDDDAHSTSGLIGPLKDAVSRIRDENLLYPIALGILVVVSGITLTAAHAAASVIYAVLAGLLLLAVVAILLRHFAPNSTTASVAPVADQAGLGPVIEPIPPSPFLVAIDDRGHYVGGDQQVAAACVAAMLSLPVTERRVVAESSALTPEFAVEHVGAYVTLRKGLRIFEQAATLLVRGSVTYQGAGQNPEYLALCLKRLWACQGLPDYPAQRWYTWPTSNTKNLVLFRMPLSRIEIERNFDDPSNGNQRFGTYALSVLEMNPEFDWEYVFPSILTHQVETGRCTSNDLDFSGWLIGADEPARLRDGKSTQRSRP